MSRHSRLRVAAKNARATIDVLSGDTNMQDNDIQQCHGHTRGLHVWNGSHPHEDRCYKLLQVCTRATDVMFSRGNRVPEVRAGGTLPLHGRPSRRSAAPRGRLDSPFFLRFGHLVLALLARPLLRGPLALLRIAISPAITNRLPRGPDRCQLGGP